MNTLYQGDNLAILRSLPDASVDLICTDPPFNTGKDWGAFDDRWQSLDKYLKFMEARAVEMRRVLKDTGSLYLHCDPTASHYLKVMLDGVFGIKQFRNEIIWCYTGASRQDKNHFPRKHDAIYYYSKSDKAKFHNDKVRIPYKKLSPKGFNNTLSPEELREYLDRGKVVEDYWVDIHRNVKIDYPTQKPLALYARMIKASSHQGDVVLDPFAGSGTTLDAAESLGRKWIGIDIGDEAIEIIQTRLRDRHGLMLEYELC